MNPLICGITRNGAAQESNLPSLGLPDLTGLKTLIKLPLKSRVCSQSSFG
jgi:hypothetical protein